jgi:hypothetical protein
LNKYLKGARLVASQATEYIYSVRTESVKTMYKLGFAMINSLDDYFTLQSNQKFWTFVRNRVFSVPLTCGNLWVKTANVTSYDHCTTDRLTTGKAKYSNFCMHACEFITVSAVSYNFWRHCNQKLQIMLIINFACLSIGLSATLYV